VIVSDGDCVWLRLSDCDCDGDLVVDWLGVVVSDLLVSLESDCVVLTLKLCDIVTVVVLLCCLVCVDVSELDGNNVRVTDAVTDCETVTVLLTG